MRAISANSAGASAGFSGRPCGGSKRTQIDFSTDHENQIGSQMIFSSLTSRIGCRKQITTSTRLLSSASTTSSST